jgi:hypothetical protein
LPVKVSFVLAFGNPPPTLGGLYPHLAKKQLAEAEQILEQYLSWVLRIFALTESEPTCCLMGKCYPVDERMR